MMMKKCPKCETYTLKEVCSSCETKTINAHPLKFSLEMELKYGKYKREAKI